MKTSFSVLSWFSVFDCTRPNIENTYSTPALDATAVSSDFHKRVRFCFWSVFSMRKLSIVNLCECSPYNSYVPLLARHHGKYLNINSKIPWMQELTSCVRLSGIYFLCILGIIELMFIYLVFSQDAYVRWFDTWSQWLQVTSFRSDSRASQNSSNLPHWVASLDTFCCVDHPGSSQP